MRNDFTHLTYLVRPGWSVRQPLCTVNSGETAFLNVVRMFVFTMRYSLAFSLTQIHTQSVSPFHLNLSTKTHHKSLFLHIFSFVNTQPFSPFPTCSILQLRRRSVKGQRSQEAALLLLMKVERQQMNWPVTGSQCFSSRWARTDEVSASNSACWLLKLTTRNVSSRAFFFLFSPQYSCFLAAKGALNVNVTLSQNWILRPVFSTSISPSSLRLKV